MHRLIWSALLSFALIAPATTARAQAPPPPAGPAYLGVRLRNPGLPQSYSAARLAQSLVANYKLTDRSTLFYEWSVLEFVGKGADERPTHYMNGGLLYRPTPNTQLDLRAGFGLGQRPENFFTGAGYSIRY